MQELCQVRNFVIQLTHVLPKPDPVSSSVRTNSINNSRPPLTGEGLFFVHEAACNSRSGQIDGAASGGAATRGNRGQIDGAASGGAATRGNRDPIVADREVVPCLE